jgi:uncharacterized protein
MSTAAANPKTRACPICGKPQVDAFQPFCSRRCADVDLHRWLSDAYAIPAVDGEEETNEMRDPDVATPRR